jgi:hypothetical protein
MTNLHGITPKIIDFIETLSETEQTELWRVVNSPEYVIMVTPTLQKEVSANLDAAIMDVFTSPANG